MTNRIFSGNKILVSLLFAALIGFVAADRVSAFGSKKTETPQASSPAIEQSAKGDTIWVARKDGGTSCGDQKGQTLEDGASDLKRVGVTVLGSRKTGDGKMHAQMCGMPTGSMNAYEIRKADLGKAITLGFNEITLKN